MSKLVIVVPVGRRAAGRAVLLGHDGKLRLAPFRVLATAGGTAATRHGNPERDWRRPFGDTPTGSYLVAGALPPSPGAPPLPEEAHADRLGALVLAPVGGNALEALRAGRTRFLVHGGAPDANGRLRSTCGGLRVSNADLASLLAAINQANADGDPVSSLEVEETATPTWKEGSLDEVPSSRNPRHPRSRPPAQPVSREVRAQLGFGAPSRSAKNAGGRGALPQTPGRRAFMSLALLALGAVGFGCSGTDGVGAGGVGGDDGGGAGGGYTGGGQDDGGAGSGGTGTHPGTTTGTTTEGTTTGSETTTGTTTSEGTTTTTSEGTTTGTTTGTDTTFPGTTTGTDTTTSPTTTGTDTTTTGTDTTTTGTDTTTTGTDTTNPGTDTTTGTDSTGTGTDSTGTGTDSTGTGTDSTGTGTDSTGTGTDSTGTGTDFSTGTDFEHKPPIRRRRRNPPRDEGSGT